MVKAARQRGIDAYGCDVEFSSEWVDQQVLAEMRADHRVRTIETPYRLPFEDELFDVVVSDQLFERVRATRHRRRAPPRDETRRRVPAHLPSRYTPIEPHVHVPFGCCFHPRWWLALWASLGVRNRYQRGLSAAQVTELNAGYLRTGVNYLPPAELRRQFSRGFRIRGAEAQFMRHSRRAAVFLLPALYRTFWQRCVHGVKI